MLRDTLAFLTKLLMVKAIYLGCVEKLSLLFSQSKSSPWVFTGSNGNTCLLYISTGVWVLHTANAGWSFLPTRIWTLNPGTESQCATNELRWSPILMFLPWCILEAVAVVHVHRYCYVTFNRVYWWWTFLLPHLFIEKN